MRSGARAEFRAPDVPSRAFCLTRAHLNLFCARSSPYASASRLRAPSSRLLARLPSIVRFAHSAFAPFSYFPPFPNKGRYVTKKPLFRDDSDKRISLQVNTSRIMPGQGTVCANGCPFRTTRHLLICYKPLFLEISPKCATVTALMRTKRANAEREGRKQKSKGGAKRERGGRGQERGRTKRARKQVGRKGAARKTRRAKRQNE